MFLSVYVRVCVCDRLFYTTFIPHWNSPKLRFGEVDIIAEGAYFILHCVIFQHADTYTHTTLNIPDMSSRWKPPPALCVVCNQVVTQRQQAVDCDICGDWTHRKCNTGIVGLHTPVFQVIS